MIAFLKSNPRERFADLNVKGVLTSFNNLFIGEEEGTIFHHAADGGTVVGGTAVCIYNSIYAYQATGGCRGGGTGASVYTANYTYAPTGGAIVNGTSGSLYASNYESQTSGGSLAGGEAVYSHTNAYAVDATGGALCSGVAETSLETGEGFEYAATGGTSTGGVGETIYSVAHVHAGEGGALLGGEAEAERGLVCLASGGIIAGGSAQLYVDYILLAAGGMKTEGAAIIEIRTTTHYEKYIRLENPGTYTLIPATEGSNYITQILVKNNTGKGGFSIGDQRRNYISAIDCANVGITFNNAFNASNQEVVVTSQAPLSIEVRGKVIR